MPMKVKSVDIASRLVRYLFQKEVINLPGTHSKRIYFANSSYEDSKYVIFGVPFDSTCTFRKGTRYGPSGIREASHNFESFMLEYECDLKDIEICDYGDLDVTHLLPSEMVERVNGFSKQLVTDGKFPLLLGGEHSVSPGCAIAFDDITVLGIDAHADYYEEYDDDRNNHACAMRRIVDKFGEDRVMWIGVRQMGKAEFDATPNIINSFTIIEKGIDWTISEIEKMVGDSKLYISLDIDGIDPAYAPGTGTPVPFGLKPIDVKKIIDRFSSRLVGFDIVEVSPPLDKGVTALLAVDILMEVIATHHLHTSQKKSGKLSG